MNGAGVCLLPQAEAVAKLFCFANAGGGPGSFRGWAQFLGPQIETWVITLPGRGSRSDEPFAQSWSELVKELGDAIEPHAGSGTFAMLGHSLGALVAYEVVRELERREADKRPARLFVASCRAPHRKQRDWRLPDDDDRLVAEVDRRYGAVPPAVRAEPELLARLVPILRADMELATSYRWTPGSAIDCPITALAGTRDKTAPPDEMRHWSDHTRGGFRLVDLSGSHFITREQMGDVTKLVRESLAAE